MTPAIEPEIRFGVVLHRSPPSAMLATSLDPEGSSKEFISQLEDELKR
jgi:hypothetical protein